jgi:zinc/manganese transport system permease protein
MEALHFLMWPFAACVLLILIHAYFGIHILERGIIFVDLSLAQFVGVGIALSFFFGYEGDGIQRYVFSIVFAVLGAVILAFSRRIAKYTNIEAFIGVLYIFSLGASILILDRSPHGFEEFKSILNGNIIWVEPQSVLHTFILYFIISIPHIIYRKRFLELSRNGDGGFLWEFIFFLSFAIVLVKSVQMAGILQVFAFLIIPALIGRLFTKEPFRVLIAGWLLGLVSSAFGIVASYKWDLPVAPIIVASLSILFFLVLLIMGVFRKKKSRIGKCDGRHQNE